MSFATILPLVFGICFQTPLVMLFLERVGIFTAADFRAKRKFAILIMVIVAAILTPGPDVFSQCMLAVPMIAPLRARHPDDGQGQGQGGNVPRPSDPSRPTDPARHERRPRHRRPGRRGARRPGPDHAAGGRCLEAAEVVVYDHLANDRLLDLAPASAERICAGKTSGRHTIPQEEINRLLVEHARRGRRVVRLKGGDPFVFGRGGEEAEHLRAEGIPFVVVPGVTAGVGVTAYAGMPVTHRDASSAVAFVTGHNDPEARRPRLDWAALAAFPGTLVIYMGVTRLAVALPDPDPARQAARRPPRRWSSRGTLPRSGRSSRPWPTCPSGSPRPGSARRRSWSSARSWRGGPALPGSRSARCSGGGSSSPDRRGSRTARRPSWKSWGPRSSSRRRSRSARSTTSARSIARSRGSTSSTGSSSPRRTA